MKKLETIAINFYYAVKGLVMPPKRCPLSDEVINSKELKAYVRNEVKVQSTYTPPTYRPTWQSKMNNGKVKNTLKPN